MPRKKTTRKAHGEGSIRQRKDGRWEARITTGKDPGTGKQVRKSFYAPSQAELLKILKQVQADIDNGIYQEPTKMTVGVWLDIWLKEYTGNVKERTRKEYEGSIAYRIKPALGKVKLSALKTHQIQKFYNDCLRGTKDKKAVSAKTIKNLHGILHKALSQAVEIGYIRMNPADACKLPRVEKTEINPLDDTQITEFLKEISGHQYEALYIVDLFTGLRQGEILGLCWDSVNFGDGIIYVQRQLQRIDGVHKLLPVKNDKIRKIAPAPSVMKLLQAQKVKQAEWRLRAGPAWDNKMKLVFTNEIGGHLVRETVYTNYKKIVRRLGLDKARFHDLRHSYALAALQSGDDVKTVQENLGHHTASFTLDIYGHVSERMRRESADRMEKFINGVKKA